ncbi:sensor histidine kinase [Elizabethkingia anophelis]|uniref:sensor histidine kinase n=1 Tax=Elizabethkingia anophelis TaxID=1117645 RepID=UPI0012B1A59D|nr:histidine kinase [Elizabethkingia anophelis]QGN22542.1 hypothetical protein GJV56_07825 [Elizabethkingia anophelis]QNV09194.1 hypothetical protein EIY88_07805 [Elizabethkingia anophelis]UTF90950.1 histidine kinase [Elizabethkingia anophelis]UTG01820.1 histidine kinase [Elizabethkingia anophelis]UTG05570.1 histidine kinase [Elizabethkingia anophelis]
MKVQGNNIAKNWMGFLLKWGGIPMSLALAHVVLFSFDPKSAWWEFYRKLQVLEIGLSLLSGIAIYGIIFLLISYLSRWIDSKPAFTNNLLHRFVITTSLVLVCMFLLLLLEDQLFAWIYTSNLQITKELEQSFRSYIIVNMIVAAFINSFYNSYMFFERWKVAMMEKNRHMQEAHSMRETALQAELRALKLQLDPHFLFNNFSILTELIQSEKEDALSFLGSLSRVYRYVLANSKKDLSTLEDELKFVESYYNLIRIRHGEAVSLTINVRDDEKKKGIPPVTLQLLIENAIKHNIVTVRQPLQISIDSTPNGSLIVSNNLQRINIDYSGTGLGLSNITERYQLLGGVKPEIFKEKNRFWIVLPLLNF